MNLKLNTYSLLLGLSCLCVASTQAQNIILYQQDWSGYANGSSVLGNGFYSTRTNVPSDSPAAGNTAIVHHNQYGNYLSLVSYAHNVGNYSPVVRTDTSFAPITLSSEYVTRISLDIRYQSPGVALKKGSSSPYSSFRFSGSGGAGWFGFFGTDKAFSGSGNVNSVETIPDFDPLSWYRFAFDLNPLDGSMLLTVFELNELGQATELFSLTPWNNSGQVISGVVTTLTAFTFEVVRPGNTEAAVNNKQVWSADFGKLTVETVIPEPATVAAMLGGGVFALVLGVRGLRRRRAALAARN